MPDSYDGSWGDFSTQVAPDLGGVFNNQDYSTFFSGLGNTLGYTGSMFDEAPMDLGYNESMGGTNWGTGQQLTPEYLQQLQQLSFRPQQGEDPSVNVYQGNKDLGNFRYGSSGGTAQKLAGMAIPSLVTGGFGAGLGALFGGGALASGAGNAVASGGMTAARGGDASQIGSSMLSSGLGSGVGTLNPAGYVGLEGTLGKAFNAGIGGSLNASLRGGDALQGGLSAAATSGINSLGGSMAGGFNDLWNSFGGDDAEFDALQGSGGDMSGQTDVSENTYNEASPGFRFGGDFSQVVQPGMKTAQGPSGPETNSFSSFMPSMSSGAGNFLGNNAGDLAAMLYGFYNNKKQQRALQGQQQQSQNSLESLYSQNSPYAQNLRANLQAKAAASGRRLDTSGRETQLQAMLADKAAQHQAALGPQMFQNQMGQNNLQNNNMNMLLQGANKMGLFKAAGQGLQGLFNPQQTFQPDANTMGGLW